MADLTPEQIALGLRAARAGWMWARGDVACNVWHATGERPYATRPAIVVTPYRDQLRVVSWGDDAHPAFWALRDDALDGEVIPDVTHRGFVSAALAQVRERTDRWWVCRALWDGARWRVEDWFCDPIHHGDYATEAEAVVAALEATR
mgnify:CR=1 FL=1